MIRTDGYAARTSISLAVAAFAGVVTFLALPLWGFDGQPTSFRYDQKSPPDPGVRYFERKGDIWIEKDANGRSASFKIDSPTTYIHAQRDSREKLGRRGTVIKRIDKPGDEYYLFIPDQLENLLSVWSKELMINARGEGWKYLGEMYRVCGYFDSYEKLHCGG